MAGAGSAITRIVVGVDGSAASVRALAWASELAAVTGAIVDAVTTWDIPASYGFGPTAFDDEDLAGAAAHALAATVADVSGTHPNVKIRSRVLRGHPATVLVDQANEADLLVVGSHGHGGFAGALLGSVSHRCVQHATCPVVVVR